MSATDRYEAIIDEALDAIVSIDADGVIVEFNRAAVEVFGYTAEEAIGREMVEMIVPEELREAHRRGFAHHLATGERSVIGQRIEIQAQRRDGGLFPVELTVTRSDHGDAPIFTAWIRDIEDRRRREMALTETTSRLEALIDNLSIGVLVEDANRRIALANPELTALFGLPLKPEELVGQDCAAAALGVAPMTDDPESFLERVDEVLASGAKVRADEIRLRDGRMLERDHLPVEVDGELTGRLWLYRDVSHRVRAERQMEEARDAALEASLMKSRFLATMSHEIKTPLTGLLGLIELLRDEELTGEQRATLRLMDESAEHMLRVVGDVLDLSKIEAGMMELRESAFNPLDEMRNVLALFTPKAEEKGLKLVASLDHDSLDGLVEGDVVRVRQIAQNLVSNAVKFTVSGTVTARACLEPRADGDPGHVLDVEVADTGPGLSQDELERVFEPFVQGEKTLRSQSGGTGLGLAICKRLVDLMGGTISVDTSPGSGATFRFSIPLSPAKAGAVDAQVREAPVGEAGGSTVLVVEDSDINREVIAQMVSSLGYGVVKAADGQEAVQVLEEHRRVACILMDCQMPRMDGYEATMAIRALQHPVRRTPIVAMTASALPDERERCLAAGMDDFLAKPMRMHQLRRTLGSWTAANETGPLGESSHPLDELSAQIGDDGLEEVLAAFRREVPQRLKAMDAAVSTGDAATLAREAHTLKSSGSLLGAEELARRCAKLEHDAGENIIEPGAVELVKKSADAAMRLVGAYEPRQR